MTFIECLVCALNFAAVLYDYSFKHQENSNNKQVANGNGGRNIIVATLRGLLTADNSSFVKVFFS